MFLKQSIIESPIMAEPRIQARARASASLDSVEGGRGLPRTSHSPKLPVPPHDRS